MNKQYKLVRCNINGKDVEQIVDVRASLTDMLRNDFRLTSVKKGCEVGECGACNVIIDGECFNSCIYLAVWAEGKHIRTLESLLKGLLLTRLVLHRIVDVHEHAHARAGNALLVAPELRGGANPHAPAVLTPHAVVDIVRTALRCGDAELVVDAGKVIGGDEPVRVLAVFGEIVAAFEAEDAAALVREPESRRVAFVVEVSGPARSMQKTACVSHFLFEGALGNSALLLLYFDFRLGERALRPAQLLYEQPFAFLAISDAGEVKRRRGIPLPRSGFCTVAHVRPPNHRPIRPTSAWP